MPGPRVGRLDIGAGMIDEVHVMHARRTGGHAGEAGEAAVDVLDHLRRRRLAALQHVLDQVDAPARANRARRRAADRSGRWRCRSRNARRSGGSSPNSPWPGRCSCSGVKLVCIGSRMLTIADCHCLMASIGIDQHDDVEGEIVADPETDDQPPSRPPATVEPDGPDAAPARSRPPWRGCRRRN